MEQAITDSLARLKTGYVDLYLVHWPAQDMDVQAVMDGMMRIKASGRARAIGVANFTTDLLRQAHATGAEIACNQVEFHVLLNQDKLLAAMRDMGLPLVAYCPLAQGRLADYPALAGVAAKHGVSPAQVALAWLLEQDGVAAIPKASRKETQSANLVAATVTLDDEDRAVIAALPKDQRFVQPGFAPAWD